MSSRRKVRNRAPRYRNSSFKCFEKRTNVITSLARARAVIEAWRREYNEERPKKSLGGLTPAQYAKHLAGKSITMPDDSKSLRY